MAACFFVGWFNPAAARSSNAAAGLVDDGAHPRQV
jgi:hypothetical protein